jgi:hypothetical protein
VLEVTVPVQRAFVHLSAYAAQELLDVPDEPRRFGSGLAQIMHRISVPGSRAPEVMISADGDSTRLHFAAFRARPQTNHPLPSVLISLPPGAAGGQLTAQWRATSASTRGDLSGSLMIDVTGDAGSSMGDADGQ